MSGVISRRDIEFVTEEIQMEICTDRHMPCLWKHKTHNSHTPHAYDDATSNKEPAPYVQSSFETIPLKIAIMC